MIAIFSFTWIGIEKGIEIGIGIVVVGIEAEAETGIDRDSQPRLQV